MWRTLQGRCFGQLLKGPTRHRCRDWPLPGLDRSSVSVSFSCGRRDEESRKIPEKKGLTAYDFPKTHFLAICNLQAGRGFHLTILLPTHQPPPPKEMTVKWPTNLYGKGSILLNQVNMRARNKCHWVDLVVPRNKHSQSLSESRKLLLRKQWVRHPLSSHRHAAIKNFTMQEAHLVCLKSTR